MTVLAGSRVLRARVSGVQGSPVQREPLRVSPFGVRLSAATGWKKCFALNSAAPTYVSCTCEEARLVPSTGPFLVSYGTLAAKKELQAFAPKTG